MAVGVPPDCPVDVDVLDKQCHQQIEEEQELEEQAAVQWQFGDPRVAHRLRSDEGRERRRRETHGITDSERGGERGTECELRTVSLSHTHSNQIQPIKKFIVASDVKDN